MARNITILIILLRVSVATVAFLHENININEFGTLRINRNIATIPARAFVDFPQTQVNQHSQ